MADTQRTEIKYDEQLLQAALADLNQVINGTAYGKTCIDSILLNNFGGVSEGLDTLRKELQFAEEQLIVLFQKTRDVLVLAGMKFQEADKQGAQNAASVGTNSGTMGGGGGGSRL